MTAADPIPSERSPSEGSLSGRRIAVFEHRELDRLVQMLEAQGAETLRCPMMAIADAPDAAPVLAWIHRAIETPFDDVVLMTGGGLPGWRGLGSRAGLEPAFREAVAQMRTVTRGPKPAQALREIGLSPRLGAPAPTPHRAVAR